MAGNATRRFGLYGAGTLLVGGLVYGGFLHQAAPDPLTILGGVDLQVRVAALLPAIGKDGRPLAVREDNLRRADADLAQVESLAPGMSVTRRYRGYVAYLREDFATALRLYREALVAPDFPAAQRSRLLLDIARLHLAAKQSDAALAALATVRPEPAVAAEAALVKATLLHERRQVAEAADVLKALATVPAEQGGMVIECAHLLERLGDLAGAADLAHSAATRCDAAGLYQIARLKFRVGDVDTALSMLELAMRADPESTRRTLQRERSLWDPVRSDPRLQAIEELQPEPVAAPGR